MSYFGDKMLHAMELGVKPDVTRKTLEFTNQQNLKLNIGYELTWFDNSGYAKDEIYLAFDKPIPLKVAQDIKRVFGKPREQTLKTMYWYCSNAQYRMKTLKAILNKYPNLYESKG